MAERVGFEPAKAASAINDLEAIQTLAVPSHPPEYPDLPIDLPVASSADIAITERALSVVSCSEPTSTLEYPGARDEVTSSNRFTPTIP